jgi:hypothetical protein
MSESHTTFGSLNIGDLFFKWGEILCKVTPTEAVEPNDTDLGFGDWVTELLEEDPVIKILENDFSIDIKYLGNKTICQEQPVKM